MNKAREQGRDRQHHPDAEMWAGIFVLQIAAPLLSAVFLVLVLYVASRNSGLRLIGAATVQSLALGQVMLAVFATAYGPWPILRRLIIPPLVIGTELVFLTVLLAAYADRWNPFSFGALGIATWVVALVPFWAIRKFSGGRLVSGSGLYDLHRGSQFTVRELLTLTLVTALLLGLARLVFDPSSVVRFVSPDVESIIIFCFAAIAMTVSALLTIYFVLSPSCSLMDMVSCTAAISIVAIAFYLGLLAVEPRSMAGRFEKLVAASAIVGQHFWIWLNLNPLRTNGWRLVRVD